MLAGQGQFRLEAGTGGEASGALCKLSGVGYSVGLRSGPGAVEIARMSDPGGRALSVRLDISVPRRLVALRHNMDCGIWRHYGASALRYKYHIVDATYSLRKRA
jgi:hypothetical protein